MKASSFEIAALLVASVLGSACASSKPCGCKVRPRASGELARFDWFEYRGQGPLVEQQRPVPGEHTDSVLTGFHPDPSVVRVGDDYYRVAASFAYFPGVPIFHSKDLVHWTQLGHVLDRPSQLVLDGLEMSEGIQAPTLRHHDGTFFLIAALVSGPRSGAFVVTATRPTGPWSDPVWLREVDGVDPSLFFDDDGRAYIVWSAPARPSHHEGDRAVWIVGYDPPAEKLVGDRHLLLDGGAAFAQQSVRLEAPRLFKDGGQYQLIAARGGTHGELSEVAFRADALAGPYRPSPVQPTFPPAPALSTGGKLVVRDDFDGPALAPAWQLVRTPRASWYDLTTSGWLTLAARPVALGSRGQPSFIGRRQQHADASVATAMAYTPTRPGDRAGLVAFQNDDCYYFLGVVFADGRPTIQVERRVPKDGIAVTTVLATAPRSTSSSGPLFLRIDAHGGAYDFSYAYVPDKWLSLLVGADGTWLSTKAATGFVGATLGMFAYSDGP